METHANKALAATRALHKRVREMEEPTEDSPPEDYKLLKKLASDANRAVHAMLRHAQDEQVRANVRENVLREAVRDELIDREANAARVIERQKFLLEQQGSQHAQAFERATATARNLAAAVAKLHACQLSLSPGVALLANDGASEAAAAAAAAVQEVPQNESRRGATAQPGLTVDETHAAHDLWRECATTTSAPADGAGSSS